MFIFFDCAKGYEITARVIVLLEGSTHYLSSESSVAEFDSDGN